MPDLKIERKQSDFTFCFDHEITAQPLSAQPLGFPRNPEPTRAKNYALARDCKGSGACPARDRTGLHGIRGLPRMNRTGLHGIWGLPRMNRTGLHGIWGLPCTGSHGIARDLGSAPHGIARDLGSAPASSMQFRALLGSVHVARDQPSRFNLKRLGWPRAT